MRSAIAGAAVPSGTQFSTIGWRRIHLLTRAVASANSSLARRVRERIAKYSSGVHIAFTAENRAQVDAFYRAALRAGGRDNGGPGLRPHYHANYYGAFVLDPDGNNIEAVCHRPR